MQQKIVAIGGGDIRTGQTLFIDQEIVRIANKAHPKLLFIPTASDDHAGYINSITQHFQNLCCRVNSLCLISSKPDSREIENKILGADIIYVGGGNTLKMMNLWRKLGIDKLLAQAHQAGTVLCGVSAGSICWFNFGNSDSRKFKNPNADYIKVTGLGLIEALHCPHYDSESTRKESLKKMLKNYKGIAIALEDCTALEIVGQTYRVLTSQPNAKAYKVYWHNHTFNEIEIIKNQDFKSLNDLIKKN
jgi:dipeptidase E